MMTNLQLLACLLLFVALVASDHQAGNHQSGSTCQCNCACTQANPWRPPGQPGTPRLPRACQRRMDCQDIKKCYPHAKTGVYTIYPKETNGIRVRCDMDRAGGGWTVIQRRISSSDFFKKWAEYQTGFGDLSTNFWLGNYPIHLLTSQSWYELRIDMTGPTGHERYAHYDLFAIADGFNKYRLMIGRYKGTAGDSLSGHNGYAFSTKDKDQDTAAANCASLYRGAWWYSACHSSNLNGQYGNKIYGKGITWYAFTKYKSSLTKVDMKIRRRPGRRPPSHLLP